MSKKGFTLIEILVVITIIGILVAMGVLGYQGANRKARDSRRQSDLEQIRTSLEIYRSDNNEYPAISGTVTGLDTGALYTELVTGGYINTLPTDPKDNSYYYRAIDDGSGNYLSYEICARLETQGDPGSPNDYCNGATCGTACNYEATNP